MIRGKCFRSKPNGVKTAEGKCGQISEWQGDSQTNSEGPQEWSPQSVNINLSILFCLQPTVSWQNMIISSGLYEHHTTCSTFITHVMSLNSALN